MQNGCFAYRVGEHPFLLFPHDLIATTFDIDRGSYD